MYQRHGKNAMEFGIFLEGDSQTTVKILREEMVCPLEVEVIIKHIRNMVHQFRSCVFGLFGDLRNAMANELACVGLGGSGTSSWEFRRPDWLISFIDRDCQSI